MYTVYSLVRLITVISMRVLQYGILRLFSGKSQKTELQGQILQKSLIQLGPLYIKIGQVAATRSDLLPPAIIKHLVVLQDDVPPMSRKQLKHVLESEYNRPEQEIFNSIFSRFDPQPLASASIAQVHKAALSDGTDVAVKIVKYHVKRDLKVNLAIMDFLLSVSFRVFPFARNQNLPRRFQEFKELLMDQADMNIEKRSQGLIARNFRNHPYVVIPSVFDEYSTDSILVMEFVNGIRGKYPEKVDMNRGVLARRAQDGIYTMLFMHGFCHGDPHPGNFFYSKDGKLILIDYGITVELSEDEKWGLTSFIYSCMRKEWDHAVERMTQNFVLEKSEVEKRFDEYKKEVLPVLKKHFDIVSGQWSIINFLGDLSKVLDQYGSHYTYNFQKVILVFLSCEGISTMIDPDIDIWENARKFADRFSPYMSEEIKERFDRYFGELIPKSIEMRDKAGETLVAPTHLHRYVLPSAYPLFVKNADGCRITDIDGNTYVDLSFGYGPHILGYNHPSFKEAIDKAAAQGSINALAHVEEMELADLIVDALPAMEKVIFCNSGTESIVQAFRLCRGYRKRDKIAKFEGHYHGFSDQGLVSSWFRFGGTKTKPQPVAGCLGTPEDAVKNTMVLQYGRDESLTRLERHADEIAGVIVEPMPAASAAYNIPFLQKLRDLCTRMDIPLIFDEVVSGFRVGYSGVQGITGVDPDITTLGKIIGGGIPCGAVAGRQKYIDMAKTSLDPFVDYEEKVFVGGTMSGNSVVCTTGIAMLTFLRDHPEVYEGLNKKTRWLADEMVQIAKDEGIPFQMKANHSIFSLTFAYTTFDYYREKQSGSNIKANIALAYYMRKNGTYMPELHTMFLSHAHTQDDLEIIRESFRQSMKDMKQDGFFDF